jgi:hypothetical protein
VDAWTSSLAVTRASHSAQPASDSAPKTHDTSGRTYQPELLQCDQVPVSLKTSRDISALGFPTCCKTWQEWVTERRGAWRQRVNAARLTSGSGSSSWRTPNSQLIEAKPYGTKLFGRTPADPQVGLADQVANWPTVCASEVRQGFQDRSRGMKGSQESLTTAVILHGQAAPASSSSHGSRQGLWLTPRANEPDSDPNFAARNADRGAHCHGTLSSQAKEQWRTPTSFDWKNTDCSTQVYLSDQVEGRTSKQSDFPTPRTCDWKSSPNASQNEKRMEAGQATLGEFIHAKHKKGDLWSTPRTGATESSRPNNKGGIPLADQAKREQWATPQAKDHKSGHRDPTIVQYKQLNVEVEARATGKLNPRWVETLMGLPIGWTMPSCTSPQTIAPMSCDSSAMELCLPPLSERSEFSLAS